MLPVSGALQLNTSGARNDHPGRLGHRRVVDVGQPLAAARFEPLRVRALVSGGKEQVPQALRPRLALQLPYFLRHLPQVRPAAGTAHLDLPAVQLALDGDDFLPDE